MPPALLLAALLPAAAAGDDAPDDARPPNVVFVMCDDLGTGELGCFGQELIKTPRLDALAARGTRFTQHYSGFPVCAPARCSLMTGMHAGHSYIRGNGYPRHRKKIPAGKRLARPEPDPRRRPHRRRAVPGPRLRHRRRRQVGPGLRRQHGRPDVNQGFDRFFGYVCQWHAHNHYPRFLWDLSSPKAARTPTPPPA